MLKKAKTIWVMETTRRDLSIETKQKFVASAVYKWELKEDRNALKLCGCTETLITPPLLLKKGKYLWGTETTRRDLSIETNQKFVALAV